MSEVLFPRTFPWREGNSIDFLIDGEQFFPSMLKAISEAQQFVLMEMYLFESGKVADKFITAFVNAVQRGLVVQLLIDGFGGKGLSQLNRDEMINAGVQLVFFNPLMFEKLKNNLHRTHRKYLIVDDAVVFVGGAGITDNFEGSNAWRETVVKAQGRVAVDWHELFIDNFQRWSKNTVPEIVNSPPINNTIQARLTYTSGGKTLEIKRNILNRINNSRKSIWFASAYFIPSRKIRKALRRAALKGKDVRLLLPGPVIDHPSIRYASRRYYARLLRYGVRIFEYQGRFTHTKMVLIDDWFTIGSANVDRWNFRWNLEANLEVMDVKSAKQSRQIMLDDFSDCKEIHYKIWVNRSKLQRAKEWLWGKVDIWLTKYM
ncbi:MAG: phosphatidylserine/phosphatidylglycerophosphate/cardiolipin synthase family protein [Cocleimonas sp.]